MVVLGDSLSKGVGIKPEETWVALVAGKQGIEIENLAKTGFNTEVSVPRVDKEVLPLKPRLVVVELGGNDALQRVEKSKTEANLEAILGKLQEEKIPVLLLGVQGGVLSDPYEDMFASLAHTYQTGYVSNILEGIVGHQELLVDNFHPNGKGHALIAERVGPVLEAMLEAQGRGQNKSKDTKS